MDIWPNWNPFNILVAHLVDITTTLALFNLMRPAHTTQLWKICNTADPESLVSNLDPVLRVFIYASLSTWQLLHLRQWETSDHRQPLDGAVLYMYKWETITNIYTTWCGEALIVLYYSNM